MDSIERREVTVVGGGVAGLSAAVFTARAGMDTLVVDAGESILRRNALLENYPGFPAGVDARLLLSMTREQAERAGCSFRETTVTGVQTADDGPAQGRSDRTVSGDAPATAPRFVVETVDGDRVATSYVVAATKNTVDYLRGVEGVGFIDRGKTFVDTDEGGRTGVEGLYVAGRLAEKPHQAVVSAGHGAEVAVRLLEDDPRPFYHDWVTPDGYFTDRGRDLPPGCEEIDDEQRREREVAARARLQERLADASPEPPRTHPSLSEE